MKHWKLRRKLLFLSALSSLVIAVLVAFSFAFLGLREAQNAITKDVGAVTSLLNSLIIDRGRTLRTETRLVAKNPILRSIMDHATIDGKVDTATISQAAKYLQDQTDADGLLITDKDGNVIGMSGVHATPARLKDRIAHALDGQEAGGLIESDGKLLLAVTIPISVGEYTKGSISSFSKIDRSTVQELKTSLDSELAFVSNGRIIASSVDGISLPSHSDTIEAVRIDGNVYLSYMQPLQQSMFDGGCSVIAIKSFDQAASKYSKLFVLLMIILGVSCLLSLAVFSKISDEISKPIEETAEYAHEIQKGNWDAEIRLTGGGEILGLQTAMKEMVQTIVESQNRLLAMLYLDPLTDLVNHRRFKEEVGEAAAKANEEGTPLSIIMFDIDRLGEINKRFGHDQGDEILKGFGKILAGIQTPEVLACRYGGEEFALLLQDCDVDAATEFAKKILPQLTGISAEVKPTASCGCAELKPGDDYESVLFAAEIALNRAKQLGRGQVGKFESQNENEELDAASLHRYLKDGSLATIQALAAAVDAKDSYTNGHSERVARYAVDLARAVGADEDTVDLVYRTGTLHDVGKIGVPDDILKKPGRLTDEERAIMETHPALGEVIVRKVPGLEETLPGVRHHHERYDGKGYPDGLAGDRIPWLARILAIADTYDAMTSDRPYRKGLDVDFALSEIEKGAGSQFDPEMVKVFVEIIRSTRRDKAA
ncbi:MAG: diguanylate cyclase [Armatimonadetes bacterium]|nr:diguanylate cyclase [Armatimonadota bacterium]